MKRVIIFTAILSLLTAGALFAAAQKAEKSEDVKTTSAVDQAGVQNVTAGSKQTETESAQAPAAPKAGEEINWQVISGGGSMNGISDNYMLSGTVGQTAVGEGTYGTNQIHHGFWQVFTTGCCDTPGDANNDGTCNIGDAVYMGNHVFSPAQCIPHPPIGCPPECPQEGDANADGGLNIGDVVYLNNYVFRPAMCATNPPIGCPPQCGP